MRLYCSVSTGYGQPCSTPSVLHDIVKFHETENVPALNKEIDQRLRVAEFCSKVTSLLYDTVADAKDLPHPSKSIIVRSLSLELRALETKLDIGTQGKRTGQA